MSVRWIRRSGIIFKDESGKVFIDASAKYDETYVPYMHEYLKKIADVCGNVIQSIDEVEVHQIALSGISSPDAIVCAAKFGKNWQSMLEYARKEVLSRAFISSKFPSCLDEFPIQSLELLGMSKRFVNSIIAVDCVTWGSLFECDKSGINKKLLRIKGASAKTIEQFYNTMIPFISKKQMATLSSTVSKMLDMRSRRVCHES